MFRRTKSKYKLFFKIPIVSVCENIMKYYKDVSIT